MLCRTDRRRGYVMVLVIVAIAIVTGLSFAMLQSSKTMATMGLNRVQRNAAKHAAETGMEHALKQMQLPTWSGPISNYAHAFDSNTGFEVQYQYETGLDEADPDYWQMPYRVKVRTTGYSIFNGRTTRYAMAASTMLSDVQLNPTKAAFAISPPPRTVTCVDRSELAGVLPPTMEFWNRINGTTHSVKGIKLWNTVDASYRSSFLNEMKTAPWSAFAPMNGRCDVEDLSLITSFADAVSILNLELFQLPQIASGSKYTPAGSTYQIYRGGPFYTIPTFTGKMDSVGFVATADNPWAIFRGIGALTLGENTIIQGTICMDASRPLTIEKEGVVVERVQWKLPDNSEFEMPVIMGSFITLQPDKDISVTGTIIADYSFTHLPKKNEAVGTILGRIYCDTFSLLTFDSVKNTTVKKSPTDLADYVSKCSLPANPYCTITDLAPTNLHWQDTSKPFLVPRTYATDGYRWSVLSIEELGFE